jgi:hypothetical protein
MAANDRKTMQCDLSHLVLCSRFTASVVVTGPKKAKRREQNEDKKIIFLQKCFLINCF